MVEAVLGKAVRRAEVEKRHHAVHSARVHPDVPLRRKPRGPLLCAHAAGKPQVAAVDAHLPRAYDTPFAARLVRRYLPPCHAVFHVVDLRTREVRHRNPRPAACRRHREDHPRSHAQLTWQGSFGQLWREGERLALLQPCRRRAAVLRTGHAPRDLHLHVARRRDQDLRPRAVLEERPSAAKRNVVKRHDAEVAGAARAARLGKRRVDPQVVDDRPCHRILPPAVRMHSVGYERLAPSQRRLERLEVVRHRQQDAALLLRNLLKRLPIGDKALARVRDVEIRELRLVRQRRREENHVRAPLLEVANLPANRLGVCRGLRREVEARRIVAVDHVVHAEHYRCERRIEAKAPPFGIGDQLPPDRGVHYAHAVPGVEMVQRRRNRLPVEVVEGYRVAAHDPEVATSQKRPRFGCATGAGGARPQHCKQQNGQKSLHFAARRTMRNP